MVKILILCTGNTCRSQMAEGFLKSHDKSLEVYSGGVEPGNGVKPKAVVVMNELGIDISGGKSSDVLEFLDIDFDYVITVCGHAQETCPVFSGNVKHIIHIGFEDPVDFVGSEEDTLNKYREVRDLIIKDFTSWYDSINKD